MLLNKIYRCSKIKNKKNGPTFVGFFIRKRAKKLLPTLIRLIKVDLFKIKIKQKQKKTPIVFYLMEKNKQAISN